MLRFENLAFLEKGVYLSVFYSLCYVRDISTDMSVEQVKKEKDPVPE